MGFDQSRYFFIIDKTLIIFFLKPDSVDLFIQLWIPDILYARENWKFKAEKSIFVMLNSMLYPCYKVHVWLKMLSKLNFRYRRCKWNWYGKAWRGVYRNERTVSIPSHLIKS